MLHSEDAQIFFGEVVAYHPNKEVPDIEVTTYDTRTLKLKHVEGDMWKRFEKYMNEGKYGEAKIEGMLPYRVDIIRGVVAGVLVVFIVVAIVVGKRRKKDMPG